MKLEATKAVFLFPALAVMQFLALPAGRAQSLPAAYDLRSVSGASWISDIQDQGKIGDCWTFASAEAMDSSLLMQGILPSSTVPPAPVVSSWALSTANGAAPSLLLTGNRYGTVGFGGSEYMMLGYVTRGQGVWNIPGTTPADSGTLITQMGGGPVSNSAPVSPGNSFPTAAFHSSQPADLGNPNLIPPVNQAPAYTATQVNMLCQGSPGNVALPTPTGTSGGLPTYSFTQGAADPQVQAIKAAIKNSGAVTTSVNAVYSGFHEVSNGSGARVPYTVVYNNDVNTQASDHEVAIIGWNDNYVVTDSNGAVTGTGAWLVQNSWGTGRWCDTVTGTSDGTFWASYNDPTIGRVGVASVTLKALSGSPTVVVQNEVGPIQQDSKYSAASSKDTGMAALTTGSIGGSSLNATGTVASLLAPPQSGTLTAIGIASQKAGASLILDIYSQWKDGAPGGTLLLSQNCSGLVLGYQLITLDQALSLTGSDPVVLKLRYSDAEAVPIVVGPDTINYTLTGSSNVRSGLSFELSGSGTWTDLAGVDFTGSDTNASVSNGGILFAKAIVAVPEPGTWGLLACGLGITLGVTRWKKTVQR